MDPSIKITFLSKKKYIFLDPFSMQLYVTKTWDNNFSRNKRPKSIMITEHV